MQVGKVKDWQTGSVLKSIFKNPGITAIEISKILNIDKSMVSQIINGLSTDEWVIKKSDNTRAIPLFVNKDRAHAVGVEIQPEFQKLVVSNLNGEILHSKTFDNKIEECQTFIEDILPGYLDTLEYEIDLVGVAIPGAIDSNKNAILSSKPFLQFDPIFVPYHIDGHNALLYIDNDIRCLGYNILTFEKEKEDFIVVFTSGMDAGAKERKRVAIGSSIFLNGKVFLGNHSCSGEYFSLFKRLINSIDTHTSVPYALTEDEFQDLEIIDALIDEISFHFGFLTNYLDISKIYISGFLESRRFMVERGFQLRKLENSVFPQYQKTEIKYARLHEYSIALGATGMVYEKLFSDPKFMGSNLD